MMKRSDAGMVVFWWAMMIFVVAGVVTNFSIFKALAVVAALCVLVIYAVQCVRSWSVGYRRRRSDG